MGRGGLRTAAGYWGDSICTCDGPPGSREGDLRQGARAAGRLSPWLAALPQDRPVDVDGRRGPPWEVRCGWRALVREPGTQIPNSPCTVSPPSSRASADPKGFSGVTPRLRDRHRCPSRPRRAPRKNLKAFAEYIPRTLDVLRGPLGHGKRVVNVTSVHLRAAGTAWRRVLHRVPHPRAPGRPRQEDVGRLLSERSTPRLTPFPNAKAPGRGLRQGDRQEDAVASRLLLPDSEASKAPRSRPGATRMELDTHLKS